MLLTLQRDTLGYFDRYANVSNGLIRDSSSDSASASIAGSGMSLACLVIAAERGYVERSTAAGRTLASLRFLWEAPQTGTRNATGFRGFFFHFLDFESGQRAGNSELSTVDSGIAIIGALVARQYFDRATPAEAEIRELADALYRRADWSWASDKSGALSHGWRPGRGFIPYAWRGYNESLFLYILGLGSPTHSLDERAYGEWTSTYRWKRVYGHEYLYGGPLFVHQLSHAWIDFRGIRDAFMRDKQSDYFENSQHAVAVQREYARRNPGGFAGYGEHSWGVTASDGPGPSRHTINDREHDFHGYRARGVPYGADDGTLSPWSVAASLPFAPGDVEEALARLAVENRGIVGQYGYRCSFNASYPHKGGDGHAWTSGVCYAIDQGPVAMMIENHFTGLIWRLLYGCPYIQEGLRRAGFTGGWLDSATHSGTEENTSTGSTSANC
ncbi:MAG: glucoamylase family protein [Gemmatimonadaceae bacterium]